MLNFFGSGKTLRQRKPDFVLIRVPKNGNDTVRMLPCGGICRYAVHVMTIPVFIIKMQRRLHPRQDFHRGLLQGSLAFVCRMFNTPVKQDAAFDPACFKEREPCKFRLFQKAGAVCQRRCIFSTDNDVADKGIDLIHE